MPRAQETAPLREAAPGDPVRVWHVLVVGTLLAAHATLCWLARPPGIMTGQDDAEYMVLGQSLRSGGYNLLFRVDQPLHAQYPPGYPALLAGWGAVFGDSFSALVSLSVLLSTAALAFTFAAVRRNFGVGMALMTLAVIAVNPALVGAGGSIASEAPYGMLSMLALLLLAGNDRRSRTLVVVFGAAILGALTRSIGVVLIGAVLATLLMERKWRQSAVLAVVSAILVGSWLAWTAIAPEQRMGTSYVADLRVAMEPSGLSRLLQQALGFAEYYATNSIPHELAVPAISGTLVDNWAWLLINVIGMATGLWVFARRWRVAAVYVVLYGGLLSIWAWRVSRYTVPLVFVLVPLLLVGWQHIGLRWNRRWANGLTAAIALALFAGGAARTAGMASAMRNCHDWTGTPPAACTTPGRAGFFAALDYIRDRLPEDAVFLVAKTGALWVYTGRLSISTGTARAQEPDAFLPYLREQGARWIVLAELGGEFGGVAQLAEANCNSLELEEYFPEQTYLFRVLDDGERAESSAACDAVRAYLAWALRGVEDDGD